MAAKKSPPNPNGKVQPNGARTRTYTTTRGVSVTLSACPPLLHPALRAALEQEWQDAGRALPPKPTYTITAAAGNVETHEHDEQTVKDNPEAAAAWGHWQTETRALESELRERLIRSVILDCMEFELDPAWDRKNKAKRVRVPDDEYLRKLFYAQTAVLGAAEDYLAVMQISAELAGAPEQQTAAVRDAFRGPLEDSGRAAAGEPEPEAG